MKFLKYIKHLFLLIFLLGANTNADAGSGEASVESLAIGRDYEIKDNTGKVWTVDEEGNVTEQELAEVGKTTPQNTDGVAGDGDNKSCFNIGYGESQEGIVTYSNQEKISDKILEIFKYIKKPLILNKYYQYANGEVRNYKYETKEDVAGYPFIKALQFRQSKAYLESLALRKKCLDYFNNLPEKGFGNNSKEENRIAYDNYKQCLSEVRDYITRELQKEYSEGALVNTTLWKKLDTESIATFREVYMDYDGRKGTTFNENENYTGALFYKALSGLPIFAKIEIAGGGNTLTAQHFYDFNTDKVLNDIVYATIDGIGCIPGADLFTDPVGAIFAFIRGDTENGAIYTASAVIPLGGATYIKGGRKAIGKFDDMYKVVAKKTDKNDFKLIYRPLNTTLAKDELHVSSVFHSVDSKIKDNIPVEDLRKYIDKDYVEYQLAKKVVDAGRKITTSELALLKRADLPDFVSNNLDDLLLAENRTAIWNLNNVFSGQFKRGDLIEEIFNQWSKKYRGYQNLNDIIPNYRTLDFDGILANVNEVVSLKSYKRADESISTLKTTLRGYVKKLNDDVAIGVNHKGKKRVLDFVLEEGSLTQKQMDDVYDYIDDLLKKYPEVNEIKITPF